jgi:hypothetical protein
MISIGSFSTLNGDIYVQLGKAIVFNEKEKSKLTTQLAAQTPILNDLPCWHATSIPT